MKKIVSFFDNATFLFCLIVFFCVEIMTEICATFGVYLSNHLWTGWGNPSNTVITNEGNKVMFWSKFLWIVLVGIPLLALLFVFIKKKMNKKNIITFTIVVITAAFIGSFFAYEHHIGISHLIYIFADKLNEKYPLFEKGVILF